MSLGVTQATKREGGLITMSAKRSDKFEAKLEQFLKVGGKKQRKTMANMRNLAAGITYLTKKDKVSMLYLPHLTTNDDATHDVFVGTGSNKANIMDAKVVDADIINNLLVLIKKNGISNDFPMGKR